MIPAQSHPARGPLPLLAAVLLLVAIGSAGVGAVQIPPREVLWILADAVGLSASGDFEPAHAAILIGIRLPRTLFAIAIGAALAVSGALMQGLFRNPLADPGLLGVSAGAAFAAAAVLVLGLPIEGLGLIGLPLAAFLGALSTTWLVARLGSPDGRPDLPSLLLAGIALNALAGAGTGMLVFLADDAALRALTFWTLGSLGGATWPQLLTLTILTLPCIAIALRLGPSLDALLLGEVDAEHLGVDVRRLQRQVVVLTALLVGCAVALCGIIGFVGLVVPHLCRMALGPGHRTLLPAAGLGGAVILLLADALARSVVAPAELPIGIVTTLVGGPFFLWLLARGAGRRV